MAASLKSLRIVPLVAEHIPAILEIEKDSNTAAWSERSFLNELDHAHGVFVVAFLDKNLVGYGGMWLVVDEAHITTVAVSPNHRRQGIGKRIMEDLLHKAEEAGMICSTLEVRASNEAAIKMYESLGYVATAHRRGYYPDNKEDALVMWKYGM